MWQKILAFLKSVWKWIRTDGLLHIACEALIVAAFGWLRPIWIPALIALAAGIGKEVYGYFHPESHSTEWHDVFCDLIGIALGIVIVLLNSFTVVL